MAPLEELAPLRGASMLMMRVTTLVDQDSINFTCSTCYIKLPNNKFAVEFHQLNNAYRVINFLGYIFGNACLAAGITISRTQTNMTFLLSVARAIIIILNRFVIKHVDCISQTIFFNTAVAF